MAQQLLKLVTVPQERRVEIFDGRITFFLFWVSFGEEPIVFINPNITEFASKLKDGIETETGGVTLDGSMQSIQFSDNKPEHIISIGGEKLRITLQRKHKFEDFDMEVDLFVETID